MHCEPSLHLEPVATRGGATNRGMSDYMCNRMQSIITFKLHVTFCVSFYDRFDVAISNYTLHKLFPNFNDI